MTMGSYTINFWGSHPDRENDDLYCSEKFDSLDTAQQKFDQTIMNNSVEYVELIKTQCILIDDEKALWVERLDIRENQDFVNSNEICYDEEHNNEYAIEDTMLYGYDGWND